MYMCMFVHAIKHFSRLLFCAKVKNKKTLFVCFSVQELGMLTLTSKAMRDAVLEYTEKDPIGRQMLEFCDLSHVKLTIATTVSEKYSKFVSVGKFLKSVSVSVQGSIHQSFYLSSVNPFIHLSVVIHPNIGFSMPLVGALSFYKSVYQFLSSFLPSSLTLFPCDPQFKGAGLFFLSSTFHEESYFPCTYRKATENHQSLPQDGNLVLSKFNKQALSLNPEDVREELESSNYGYSCSFITRGSRFYVIKLILNKSGICIAKLTFHFFLWLCCFTKKIDWIYFISSKTPLAIQFGDLCLQMMCRKTSFCPMPEKCEGLMGFGIFLHTMIAGWDDTDFRKVFDTIITSAKLAKPLESMLLLKEGKGTGLCSIWCLITMLDEDVCGTALPLHMLK